MTLKELMALFQDAVQRELSDKVVAVVTISVPVSEGGIRQPTIKIEKALKRS